MTETYPNTKLHIGGKWVDAVGGETIDVINPATGEPIGAVAHARTADLDLALEAAKSGFEVWKKTSPFSRYKMMRNVASLLKERVKEIVMYNFSYLTIILIISFILSLYFLYRATSNAKN